MLIAISAAFLVAVMGALFWLLRRKRISKRLVVAVSSLAWAVYLGITVSDIGGPSYFGASFVTGGILGALGTWVVLHILP